MPKNTAPTKAQLAVLNATLSASEKGLLWTQLTRAYVTELVDAGLVPAKTKRGTSTIALADSVALGAQIILTMTSR